MPPTAPSPRIIQRRPGPGAALSALVALAGCTSGAMPRTAEVARPGFVKANGQLPVTYAPGEATGRASSDAGGGSVAVEGSSAAHFNLPLALMALPIWFEGALRLGVFAPCEVGPIVSLFRQGAELRCGPLQQPDGAPLSIALSAAGAWQPFGDEHLWFRGGLDVSRAFGGLHLSLGAHATHGTTVHHVRDVPERYGDPGKSHVDPTVRAELSGWRLHLPVGVHLDLDDATGVTWGVVPYLTLDEAPTRLACLGCTLDVQDFEAPWGISFVLGFRGGTDDPWF